MFGATPGIDTVVYARKELTGDVGAAGRDGARRRPAQGRAPVAVYAIDGVVKGPEAAVYRDASIPVFASAHELLVAVARSGRPPGGGRAGGGGPAAPGTSRRRVLDAPASLGEHAAKQALAAYGFEVTREELVQ